MGIPKKKAPMNQDDSDLAREGHLRARAAVKILESGIAVVVSKTNDTMLMAHIRRLVHVPPGVYDPMEVMRKFLANDYLSRKPVDKTPGQVAAVRDRSPLSTRPPLRLSANPAMRLNMERAQAAEPCMRPMSSPVQHFTGFADASH